LRRYTEVYFPPNTQFYPGVLDTTDGSFSTIATTGNALSGFNKYSGAALVGTRQGPTLVDFSAQPKPFWSHLPVSPCLI
jgi:hypothetical protein